MRGRATVKTSCVPRRQWTREKGSVYGRPTPNDPSGEVPCGSGTCSRFNRRSGVSTTLFPRPPSDPTGRLGSISTSLDDDGLPYKRPKGVHWLRPSLVGPEVESLSLPVSQCVPRSEPGPKLGCCGRRTTTLVCVRGPSQKFREEEEEDNKFQYGVTFTQSVHLGKYRYSVHVVGSLRPTGKGPYRSQWTSVSVRSRHTHRGSVHLSSGLTGTGVLGVLPRRLGRSAPTTREGRVGRGRKVCVLTRS